MNNQKRNLNPTPEAVIAMNLWSREYAEQRGGSMDFYDQLKEMNKKRCKEIVAKVLEAHASHSV